ncbi:hypothetical protein [Chryseobacterium sp. SIMBA_028]|uniref:hypothetical protein n=1 Tax=Chryseobacterium sp. SIMBA_028 TaxID=3085771 RepID=UPI00397C131E
MIIRVTRPVRLTMYDGWAGNGGPGNGGHDMGGGPGDYGGGEVETTRIHPILQILVKK